MRSFNAAASELQFNSVLFLQRAILESLNKKKSKSQFLNWLTYTRDIWNGSRVFGLKITTAQNDWRQGHAQDFLWKGVVYWMEIFLNFRKSTLKICYKHCTETMLRNSFWKRCFQKIYITSKITEVDNR